MKYNQLIKLYKLKKTQIESLQNEIEKYKKNKIVYCQVIGKLREEIKQKDNLLASIYNRINGNSRRNIV